MIKPGARLCPFCGHVSKSIYLPLDTVLMIVLALAIGGSILICFKLLGSKLDYGRFRGQLVVLNSRVNVDNSLSSTVGSEAWNSRDLKSRPH